MARLNPAGLKALRERLTDLALKGAEAGADTLREKLGQAGSGERYPGMPNPSSRPGEYPARQTGELQRSIAARAEGNGQAAFGPISDPPDYVVPLHFKPPSDGGRPFLDFALADPDIHAAVKEALGVK